MMTPDDERAMLQVIDERDAAADWADHLAELLAPRWVRGDHSNVNNPWRNALDYASGLLKGRGISPFVEESEDYSTLHDHILNKLNPPDDDVPEVSNLCTAIDRAVEFIESQPCTCPEGAYDNFDKPCQRCWVLGVARG